MDGRGSRLRKNGRLRLHCGGDHRRGRGACVFECGGLEPQASTVGEIAPTQEFYTFDAKYKDESSRLYIPAHITEEQIATVRQDAVRVYTALGCRGLSRVDFFVTHDSGEVVFNELNAIPGFTSISMYPKLFDYEGIGYAELLDRLISLALEEHNG